MQERRITELLHELGSRSPRAAWADFLESYSSLILQVVRLFERDTDQIAECFLYVCQELSRHRFRRLRRFHPEGLASFSAWLRAVVRNLCCDWYRREFGRHRVFQAVARLSALDREVFGCVFEQGLSREESYLCLRRRFPYLTHEETEASLARLHRSLTPRHLWLLSLRRPSAEPLAEDPAREGPASALEISAPEPDPEVLATVNEQRAALQRVLARLPKPERLLIRLRFEQGLTLEQVARLTGLGSAQKADYRIKEILERLRKELT
jgi:RNA polymerase sigma factor (sigma-70 family)